MVITHIVAANCDDPPTGEPPPRLRRWGYWSSLKSKILIMCLMFSKE
eukprot:COSAG06_NODE_72183_length_174_cov_33.386667_1_plen_46_part_10